MHTIHSRGFLAQHVGCAQPNAPPTWPALSWPPNTSSPLRASPLSTSSCCWAAWSSPPLFCLQGCLFWGTLPCLPVGRTVPSSAPAILCQVLGFAWRWAPLPLAHLARCLWWIPRGCMKLVWMHGLGLAGRPWALAAWPPWALSPSPASHSPCWSWLVAQTALAGRDFGSRCQEM